MDYCDKNDFTKIKIDFTLRVDKSYLINNIISIDYIKKQLNEYPQIKYIILVVKRYLKIKNMNELYEGGISSFSLYLMVLNTIKMHQKKNYLGKYIKSSELLVKFFKRFSRFQFNVVGIGKDNYDYDLYYNFDGVPHILNPLNGDNVAKGRCKGRDINNTFSNGYQIILSLFSNYDNKDMISSLFSLSKNEYRNYLRFI